MKINIKTLVMLLDKPYAEVLLNIQNAVEKSPIFYRGVDLEKGFMFMRDAVIFVDTFYPEHSLELVSYFTTNPKEEGVIASFMPPKFDKQGRLLTGTRRIAQLANMSHEDVKAEVKELLWGKEELADKISHVYAIKDDGTRLVEYMLTRQLEIELALRLIPTDHLHIQKLWKLVARDTKTSKHIAELQEVDRKVTEFANKPNKLVGELAKNG